MKKSTLVSYDIHDDDYRDAILDWITKHTHTQLTESTYVIMTDQKVSAVRDKLVELAGEDEENITCFVFRAQRPWAGAGSDSGVYTWLHKNLTPQKK